MTNAPLIAARTAQGLYDPANEHDACGVALVAQLSGEADHRIVERALTALRNLEHRGATGSGAADGDGAGILVQVPDTFLRAVCGFDLPPAGAYAVGLAFLPGDTGRAGEAVAGIERIVAEEGLTTLGWRDVPVEASHAGSAARAVMPRFRQLFLAAPDGRSGIALERLAFRARRRAEREAGVYFASLSPRTLVYKGMLTALQLERFFPDVADERFATALALVHSRFSTNTLPSWPLAHPYRYVAHNGEINTIKGNRNWMRAREAQLASDALGADLAPLLPVCTPGGSDSMSFDEALELLHLAGRPLPHAVLMMIPEAWAKNPEMDPARRAFYEFHASLMEPWDGPACVTFSDGTLAGAVLDRNGLRPARWCVTDDGLVVLASETGVLDLPPESIVRTGRLQPGRMFLVDLQQHRLIDDEEVKDTLAAQHPYTEWVRDGLLRLPELPTHDHVVHTHESVLRRQRVFGYTEEELKVILAPMAANSAEPIGSMGNDAPLAALSERPRLLFDYFAQQFAQVTNPPLDAIREELVTSLTNTIGPEGNLLAPTPASCRQIEVPFPVIDNDELAKMLHIHDGGEFPDLRPHVISGLWEVAGGGPALAARLTAIRREASAAIADGARLIVLSDRDSDARLAPIPSLLLTGAVHHHLIRERTRTLAGLVVEAGDAREVHHVALLVGYGAAAVNPYLAMESVEDLVGSGVLNGVGAEDAVRRYVKALNKGVLKVMSKMGISTVASYCGAQVFEAFGLSRELVEEYFTGTASPLGGVGMDVLAAEVAARHRLAWPADGIAPTHRRLPTGGRYQWRRDGETHLFNPVTVFKLQHATRTKRYEIFREYTRLIDDQSQRLATLRGLFTFRQGARPPVPLDEVEPVSSIVRRFSTGAMSYGSISAEAHETLALAMNSLDARSNTGEGGEDPERYYDDRRSSIKQVASGRFGVTAEYLSNADDLQIKMAQGAKPGEGGQLPGHKVYPWIAQTRHSTPGVGLISPPPHHDIYSIEDLKQLIYDLKNANPRARVHVKLVSEVGVGTVAAGVVKAKADVVLISGHDGGTGAAPLTSIKHVGAPWELGLAETQQTLRLSGLRDRVVVQTDGQLKTGRDVVIAALLGAEEFGFATAPLVVSGCVMMRVCHLNTCPVGVATQDPELRKRYTGKPEFVVTFFQYIAQEVREHLAALGFRSIEEAVGHAEMIETRAAIEHWKADGLDIAPVLHVPDLPGEPLHNVVSQDHGLDAVLDRTLIELCRDALEHARPVRLEMPIRNVNRTVGTMLGHEVTKRYRAAGLPDGTIEICFNGSAGQSFGAFLPAGITLRLLGDTNDYLAKGLSGGRIVVSPSPAARFAAEDNVVAGNVALYGATGGEAFVSGLAGERFAVRNSGATAVVEGVGDHGCEYMTGGAVAVLGPTGRNFAAGMSGGVAYVYRLDRLRVNQEMVDLDPLDDDDRELLASLVSRHQKETGSALADRLLGDWPTAVEEFVKVMPKDYKRVLAARARAESEGLDMDEQVMAAAHG